MPGVNVNIEQKITKRIREFLGPDGKIYEGGPEGYMGNKMGGAGLPDNAPTFGKKE